MIRSISIQNSVYKLLKVIYKAIYIINFKLNFKITTLTNNQLQLIILVKIKLLIQFNRV